MILLKTLTIKNWLSHENTTLNFSETEKALLNGRSGSGKSTVVDSILWCLFGRARSENRALVRRGSKMATVSLKLNDGSIETLIMRSVSSAGKNTLTVTQNKGVKGQFLPIQRVGIKDTQDWIENTFLRSSFELFTNSVAYPQDNQNSFVKATAARRKDLLLEIVHAGSFDDLYEKARKALAVNETDYAVILSKIENYETVIKNATEISKKYDSCKKDFDEVSLKIDSFIFSEKAIEKQINDISQISNQIKDKKMNRNLLAESIEINDRQLENDKKLIEEHVEIDIESARKNVLEATILALDLTKVEEELKASVLAQQKINAHLANKPSVTDFTKEIELINARLIPLIKDSGKCPAGDACPFVVPIKGQIEFLSQQINEKTERGRMDKFQLENWEKEYVKLVPPKDFSELNAKAAELRNKIQVLNKSNDIIAKYEAFDKTFEEIKAREAKIKEEKAKNTIEIARIDTQIYELEQVLAKFDINKANIDLANIRISIQQLQKTKEEASICMAMATNAKEAIEQASTGLVELRKGIIKATEDKECLELLKEALGSKGIRAVVIDYLIPQLEERINGVLGQLSDFRIRLDTQQSKADPEEGTKEGLFIIVKNPEGEELPISNLSGGESVKVSMAIAEGLASLGSSVGFRLLDECITALDSESTESFVEVLLKLQEKFPQILLISHLDDVKNIMEKRIMVTKVNGISKINE